MWMLGAAVAIAAGLMQSAGLAQVADTPATVTIESANTPTAPGSDQGAITINLGRKVTTGMDSLATAARSMPKGLPAAAGSSTSVQRGFESMNGALSNLQQGAAEDVQNNRLADRAPAGQQVPSGRKMLSAAGQGTTFLQPPIIETSAPTVSRAGVSLPLRPEMLPEAPMPMTVPTVNVTTLTNGIVLYHYESRDLPRIQISMLIDAGSRLDPADKVGLSDLTVRALRSGGAAGRAGDDVDRELEQIGSDLSLSVNRDYVDGDMFALTENADKAVKILADILLHPEFDEKKLEQQRSLILEGIRRQNDEPADISRREFRKIIYGPDHWLARTPTAAQVKSLTRTDVQKFYEEWFRPSSLRIGVTGDISKADAQKLIESAFASWNKLAANVPPRADVAEDRDTSTGVFYIRKMTAQSQIRMGHLGMSRLSPDRYAVSVLNGIYGTGGFSSRLMNRVRTKRGFGYGVGGGVMNDDPKGIFLASAASKSKTTAAAIEEIMDVTRQLLTGDITDDEIEVSKRDTVFQFLTEFARPAQVIDKYMLTDFQGYPPDYLQTFVERTRAVTREQIVEAAKKYIHPDRLKLLVIGFEKQFDKPVSTFGPVTEVKLEQGEE
jgi:predicted Zn-dependent peptidase